MKQVSTRFSINTLIILIKLLIPSKEEKYISVTVCFTTLRTV
jgi:hypothetical protein